MLPTTDGQAISVLVEGREGIQVQLLVHPGTAVETPTQLALLSEMLKADVELSIRDYLRRRDQFQSATEASRRLDNQRNTQLPK